MNDPVLKECYLADPEELERLEMRQQTLRMASELIGGIPGSTEDVPQRTVFESKRDVDPANELYG
jgi:hypothetical protein